MYSQAKTRNHRYGFPVLGAPISLSESITMTVNPISVRDRVRGFFEVSVIPLPENGDSVDEQPQTNEGDSGLVTVVVTAVVCVLLFTLEVGTAIVIRKKAIVKIIAEKH